MTMDIEGKYIVQSDGRVWSCKRSKFLTPSVDRGGYEWNYLTIKGEKIFTLRHRLVAKCFIPNPLGLPQVNHIDGNKRNNRVSNLEWCTASENVQHAFDTGLAHVEPIYGERNHAAILSETEVVEIWGRLCSGEAVTYIQKSYPHVSKDTIYSIKQGKSWNCVTGLPVASSYQKRKSLMRNIP